MKRSRFLAGLVLPATLILSGCGDDPAAHADAAQRAFAAEDYGHARVEALAALDAQGENRDLLLLLVRSQLALGDGNGAQATVERLRRAGLAAPQLNRLDAEAALLRGQAKAATDKLASDSSADAWRIRAAAKLAEGDGTGALDAFKRGVAAGNDPALLRDYARFLLDAEDYVGAEAQVAILQRIRPDGFDTLMLTGDLAGRTDRWDAASRAWRKAAYRYPGRPEPLLAQADAADEAGQVDEAQALVERAAQVAPDSPGVARMRVQIAAEKGEWQKVLDTLAPREASLDPLSPEGLSYAEALLRLNRAEQARSLFARALLLSPQNPYARIMLAESQLATGDATNAFRTVKPLADSALAGQRELALAEKAARGAGDASAASYAGRLGSANLARAQSLAAAGQAAMNRRDWNAAIAAYTQLPGYQADAEVLKRLALATSGAGRSGEAIGYADKALALQPANADMLHMAGLVRFNAGTDRAEAVRLMAQALAADPANRLFQADLARARQGAG